MELKEILKENFSRPSHLEKVLYPEKNIKHYLKDDISEDRLLKCLPQLKKQIAFYRAYPDIFVDEISGYNAYVKEHGGSDEGWKGFKFFYYQRITLRALMRHRKIYIVFSRGFSKSFLSMMALMCKAILYPNAELFITTGGKSRIACDALS